MTVSCEVHAGGHGVEPVGTPAAALALARARGGFVRVTLTASDAAELGRVADALGVPAPLAAGAADRHERPGLEVVGAACVLVVRTVTYREQTSDIDTGELVFLVTPDAVLVVAPAGSEVTAVRATASSPGPAGSSPWAVVHAVCDAVGDAYTHVADELGRDLEQVEESVFATDRQSDPRAIYQLKRENLEFRRALVPLVPVLTRLARGKVPLVGPASALFADLVEHVEEDVARSDTIDSLLVAVLQAHLAWDATRQGEHVRTISAWAAILAVPTAITALYAMNFHHMSELAWRFGYPALMTVIVVICALLYLGFRRSGWL